jgi:hypothetical protein
MLRFYADKFARTTDDIGAIRALATTQPRGTHLGKETGDSFKENIVDLIEQLRGMKLKMTQLTAERLLKELENGYIFNDNIVFLLNQIMERLMDELSGVVLFSVPDNDKFEPSSPLFGHDVESKFPQMSEDISEAGKCLALDRPTATVFHLMRVVEIGVQRFGDKIGVNLASEKNWQNILDESNKAIKAMDQKATETKAFAAASAHLYNVKIGWRNEVMHPKQTYTADEAKTIFSSVELFIRDLAGLI